MKLTFSLVDSLEIKTWNRPPSGIFCSSKRPVLVLNLRINSESQTGLGKLPRSKLLVQRAVLIDIVADESDGGRDQPGQQNDRKQNQQERGPAAPAAEKSFGSGTVSALLAGPAAYFDRNK